MGAKAAASDQYEYLLANIFCNWNTRTHIHSQASTHASLDVVQYVRRGVECGRCRLWLSFCWTEKKNIDRLSTLQWDGRNVSDSSTRERLNKWTTEQSSFYRLAQIQHVFDRCRPFLDLTWVALEHELTIEHKYFQFSFGFVTFIHWNHIFPGVTLSVVQIHFQLAQSFHIRIHCHCCNGRKLSATAHVCDVNIPMNRKMTTTTPNLNDTLRRNVLTIGAKRILRSKSNFILI